MKIRQVTEAVEPCAPRERAEVKDKQGKMLAAAARACICVLVCR